MGTRATFSVTGSGEAWVVDDYDGDLTPGTEITYQGRRFAIVGAPSSPPASGDDSKLITANVEVRPIDGSAST